MENQDKEKEVPPTIEKIFFEQNKFNIPALYEEKEIINLREKPKTSAYSFSRNVEVVNQSVPPPKSLFSFPLQLQPQEIKVTHQLKLEIKNKFIEINDDESITFKLSKRHHIEVNLSKRNQVKQPSPINYFNNIKEVTEKQQLLVTQYQCKKDMQQENEIQHNINTSFNDDKDNKNQVLHQVEEKITEINQEKQKITVTPTLSEQEEMKELKEKNHQHFQLKVGEENVTIDPYNLENQLIHKEEKTKIRMDKKLIQKRILLMNYQFKNYKQKKKNYNPTN